MLSFNNVSVTLLPVYSTSLCSAQQRYFFLQYTENNKGTHYIQVLHFNNLFVIKLILYKLHIF